MNILVFTKPCLIKFTFFFVVTLSQRFQPNFKTQEDAWDQDISSS